MLPTGNPADTVSGIQVSCVDVAVPMVIIRAADLGKTGHESIRELSADADFMGRLKKLWVEAGLKMKLRRKGGSLMTAAELGQSETIPKVCIVSESRIGADLAVRYFTPQTVHASLAVSGGCCLAAATLIRGSIAHEFAPKHATSQFSEVGVDIENPAGILSTTVVASLQGSVLSIRSAAYRRSAQVLLVGGLHVAETLGVQPGGRVRLAMVDQAAQFLAVRQPPVRVPEVAVGVQASRVIQGVRPGPDHRGAAAGHGPAGSPGESGQVVGDARVRIRREAGTGPGDPFLQVPVVAREIGRALPGSRQCDGSGGRSRAHGPHVIHEDAAAVLVGRDHGAVPQVDLPRRRRQIGRGGRRPVEAGLGIAEALGVQPGRGAELFRIDKTAEFRSGPKIGGSAPNSGFR